MQTVTQGEAFAPNFEAARLSRANLENANLSGARARFVDFREANLTRAAMFGALLQGADLRNANLQTADLTGARIRAAKLAGANLAGANLADSFGLAQEQIDSAFGDASTALPAHLRAPRHWPTGKLGPTEARIEWDAWRADPAAYAPARQVISTDDTPQDA
jgi:uncharacterized protein YjbI with pentapeptide repeats